MIPDMMSCRGERLAARQPEGGPAGPGERGADGAGVRGTVCSVWDAAGVDLGRDYCGVGGGSVKLIKMTAVERLKESDRGLREAIAWASGYIEECGKTNLSAVYKVKDVSELLNYFYQLMRDGR